MSDRKNKLYFTENFKKILRYISKDERDEIKKLHSNLENSFSGKLLVLKWLYEKRITKGKRIYYVSFLKYKNKILFVDYGDKKHQQITINNIKRDKEIYLNYMKNLR